MFPKRRAFAAHAVGDQLKFNQDFGIRQLLLAAMCSFCVLSLLFGRFDRIPAYEGKTDI